MLPTIQYQEQPMLQTPQIKLLIYYEKDLKFTMNQIGEAKM